MYSAKWAVFTVQRAAPKKRPKMALCVLMYLHYKSVAAQVTRSHWASLLFGSGLLHWVRWLHGAACPWPAAHTASPLALVRSLPIIITTLHAPRLAPTLLNPSHHPSTFISALQLLHQPHHHTRFTAPPRKSSSTPVIRLFLFLCFGDLETR